MLQICVSNWPSSQLRPHSIVLDTITVDAIIRGVARTFTEACVAGNAWGVHRARIAREVVRALVAVPDARRAVVLADDGGLSEAAGVHVRGAGRAIRRSRSVGRRGGVERSVAYARIRTRRECGIAWVRRIRICGGFQEVRQSIEARR